MRPATRTCLKGLRGVKGVNPFSLPRRKGFPVRRRLYLAVESTWQINSALKSQEPRELAANGVSVSLWRLIQRLRRARV